MGDIYPRRGQREYPSWVCARCGFKYGKRVDRRMIATWHEDVCGVCGEMTSVTEARDWGHLKDGWESERP